MLAYRMLSNSGTEAIPNGSGAGIVLEARIVGGARTNQDLRVIVTYSEDDTGLDHVAERAAGEIRHDAPGQLPSRPASKQQSAKNPGSRTGSARRREGALG